MVEVGKTLVQMHTLTQTLLPLLCSIYTIAMVRSWTLFRNRKSVLYTPLENKFSCLISCLSCEKLLNCKVIKKQVSSNISAQPSDTSICMYSNKITKVPLFT